MYSKRTAFLLFFILLLDACASGLLMPMIMQALAIDGNDTATAMTLQDLMVGSTFVIALSPAYLVAAPIIGHYADQYGRKKALLICISLSIASYSSILLGYHITSIAWMLFGMLLFSIGSSSLIVVQTAITDISQGATRTWYFGLLMIAMLAMLMAEQFSLTLLDKNFSHFSQLWNPLWLSLLLETLCLLLVVFFLMETKAYIASSPRISLAKFLLSLIVTFRNKTLCGLFFILLLVEVSWGLQYQNGFSLLTKAFGYSTQQANFSLLYEGIVMVLGLASIYPWLVKYYAPHKLLVYAMVCVILGALFELVSGYAKLIWLTVLPDSLATALLTPLLWLLIANTCKPKHIGLVMGIVGPIWALGWSISGFLTSPLANVFIALPNCVAIILMIVSIGLLKRLNFEK